MKVGEVCASGILFINEDAPKALVNGSGRILMVIAVLAMAGFVFAKSYRSLELVGDCGFVVVVVMVIVVMVSHRSHLFFSSGGCQSSLADPGFLRGGSSITSRLACRCTLSKKACLP